jgi:head-tail adaptor
MAIATGVFGALRRVVDDTSPDVARIQRATTTADGMGGRSAPVWLTIASVACRVAWSLGDSPWERVLAEQVTGGVPVTITVPTGTDVTPADRILVGSDTFQVIGVAPPRSYEVRRRVICVKVGAA